VSLAHGDVVPHAVIQSPRLRLGEFETHAAKRLLQQYLHNSGHRLNISTTCPPTRLSQDLRAKRDSKLAYLTAWVASFVRVRMESKGRPEGEERILFFDSRDALLWLNEPGDALGSYWHFAESENQRYLPQSDGVGQSEHPR
jgi:hypothetical protein